MQCPICKSVHFHRRHRSFTERLRYAAVYECELCRSRDLESYAEHFPYLSTVARCPECGDKALRVQRGVDPVERLSRHPLSLLQKFFKAPLLYCPHCRLQFYDRRPLLTPKRGPSMDAPPRSDSERSTPPASAQRS